MPLLLVEDDPFVGEALRDFFTAEGFDLNVATSPSDAKRLLAALGERAIVLVDPVATWSDGAWLRKLATDGHAVVVIALAIHNLTQAEQTAAPAAPIRRVLSPESLVETVRELLDPSCMAA